MTVKSQRMTRVDTAWLHMDTPANLMMIMGVLVVEPRLDYEPLCERIQQRMLQYSRFHQRVVEDAAGASWVDDEDFDIHHHVVREPLKRKRGQSSREALQDRVAELASTPLDPQRPLWQYRLVEDFDGGSVLIARFHHCIADGIALISVMLSVTDGGIAPPARRKRPADDADENDFWGNTVIKPMTDVLVKAIGKTGNGVVKSMDALINPQTPVRGAVDIARMGAQIASDVAALALMPDDSPTQLKGKPGITKKVAWADALPLDAVKVIGKALNASINDVLLSCVAGAIGSYLQARGEDPSGKEIRAMVPVNLRPLDKAYQLGNRFGLVPLVLPIGIANPVERLYALRARMAQLKSSYQPVLAYSLLQVAGLLIKPVQQALFSIMTKKTTAVMTNVPGPTVPLKFCGSTINQLMFWVPQSGDIGMGVSILTYAGNVQFGLITDSKLCPNPQDIIDRFKPEFDQLLTLGLMLPWGDE